MKGLVSWMNDETLRDATAEDSQNALFMGECQNCHNEGWFRAEYEGSNDRCSCYGTGLNLSPFGESVILLLRRHLSRIRND